MGSAKRRLARQNIPHRKGKKRCPRCQANAMIDGKCACGYGKSNGISNIEIEEAIVATARSSIIVMTGLALAKNRKMPKDEESKEQ